MVADAALRTELITASEFADSLGHLDGHREARVLHAVTAHADGARESPAESMAFARFVEFDVALPECNPTIVLPDGTRVRPDFRWRKHRVIGEVDGRIKYDDPFGGAAETLWREKLRQSALEDAGNVVVRWTAREVEHAPLTVIERLIAGSRRAHDLYGAQLLAAGRDQLVVRP